MRLPLPLAAVVVLAVLLPGSQAAAAPAMGIRLLSPTRQVVVQGDFPVPLETQISGLVLDSHDMGRRNIAGHGHIQVYLDRIPAGSNPTQQLRALVAAVAVPAFSWQVSFAWARAHRGHHRLIVTLAANNYAVYRGVKPAFVPIDVR